MSLKKLSTISILVIVICLTLVISFAVLRLHQARTQQAPGNDQLLPAVTLAQLLEESQIPPLPAVSSHLPSHAPPVAKPPSNKELNRSQSSTSSARIPVSTTASVDKKDSFASEILSQKYDLSNPVVRAAVVRELKIAAAAEQNYLIMKADQMGLPMIDQGGAVLVGFDGDQPLYDRDDNENAAISTATNLVRAQEPFLVEGNGLVVGLWEASGIPRLTHVELSGRASVGDSSSTTSSHASHVAGTLIATGLNPVLKGMAPKATLIAHTSGSDIVEMTALAAATPNDIGKILISNHSYSSLTGWSDSPWRWYGIFSNDSNPNNDFAYNFGRYRSSPAAWDSLVWNAPYYLPFKSAGNDRNDNKPPDGTVWRHNSSNGTQYTYNSASHPLSDYDYRVSSGTTGFDTINSRGCAKNIMTVGSVTDAVLRGVRHVNSAYLSSFSSAGPTDDGRIKPDIVANGKSLKSLDDDSDTDTTTKSGTSMATPNAAGSALILQEYFKQRFSDQAMRASTLKGLIIHTADDLGNQGPDYRYGWGLMNTLAAANLIRDYGNAPEFHRISEPTLQNGTSQLYKFYWDGASAIKATLCWTDPAGPSTSAHDSRTPRLVNDLDLKLTAPDGVSNFYPYRMPWVGDWTDAKLDADAMTGVNTVDNVEQIYTAMPPEVGVYTVSVSHTGKLSANSPQDYSLILSGGVLPSAFGDWRILHYPTTWEDDAVGGFNVDPDHNGLPNGIEYAFDFLFTSAPPESEKIYSVEQETVGEVSFFSVIFDRDTSKKDISYEAQWSEDLNDWQPLASIIQATVGSIETVKATVQIDESPKFVRLIINQRLSLR